MTFTAGDRVVALIRIEERGFHTPEGLYTHACPGDRGRVVSVDDQFLLVLWSRTRTASTCHHAELAPLIRRA
jgi:hypothetical protein